MYTDALSDLMNELGRLIHLPRLEVDENGFCAINYPNMNLKVEFKADDHNLYLEIFCQLGEVPPGRFREDVFHEALRANELPYPRYGNFGYHAGNNNLVLWELLPLKELRASDLAEYLAKFMMKGNEVKQSLQQNTVPTLAAQAKVHTSGIFGLR